MSKRTLFFSSPAYLSLRNNQLVWKIPEIEKDDTLTEEQKAAAERTFPIEDIGIIVLDNRRLTLTHGLMDALLASNCAIVTCDQRSMPVGLFLPLAAHSLQQERFAAQVGASLPLKKQLWQQTMRAKIGNQASALHLATQAETGCLRAWAREVRSGDPDNLEGRAAVYYWKNLFANHIGAFRRDRMGPPPNNLLNYAYAILRSCIARALTCHGLLPTLGIHHHNRYNAYCLADDVMEPYRPYADLIVRDIVTTTPEALDELTRATKAKLLSVVSVQVCIDGQNTELQTAALQTAASLAKCFLGETDKLSYPRL